MLKIGTTVEFQSNATYPTSTRLLGKRGTVVAVDNNLYFVALPRDTADSYGLSYYYAFPAELKVVEI